MMKKIRRSIKNRIGKTGRGVLTIAAAAVLLAGCGGQTDKLAETESTAEPVTEAGGAAEEEEPIAETETGTESGAEAGSEPETETEAETGPEEETEAGASDDETTADGQDYGVMYAKVADVQSDENGASVYSLQDMNDPENIWTLDDSDIGAIEADLEKGGQAAFLFSGDMAKDPDGVSFIAAVPYETYRIDRTEGVTLNNSMSAFTLKTDSGEELNFLKDNCKIEPDSLTKSEGDRILVHYAYGEEDQVYYPLEIFAAK